MAKCACNAALVDGKCPWGCDAFRKPHRRQATTQARARERAQKAVASPGIDYAKVNAPRGRW